VDQVFGTLADVDDRICIRSHRIIARSLLRFGGDEVVFADGGDPPAELLPDGDEVTVDVVPGESGRDDVLALVGEVVVGVHLLEPGHEELVRSFGTTVGTFFGDNHRPAGDIDVLRLDEVQDSLVRLYGQGGDAHELAEAG